MTPYPDDGGREAVIDEAALRVAGNLARKAARGNPLLAAELRSAARLGLVDAARRYTPARGPWRPFSILAIRSAIRQELRSSRPYGYRRAAGVPRLLTLDAPSTDLRVGGRPPTLAMRIAQPDRYGRRARAADEVARLIGLLPPEYRDFMRLIYDRPAPLKVEQAARLLGWGRHRAYGQHRRAVELMRRLAGAERGREAS